MEETLESLRAQLGGPLLAYICGLASDEELAAIIDGDMGYDQALAARVNALRVVVARATMGLSEAALRAWLETELDNLDQQTPAYILRTGGTYDLRHIERLAREVAEVAA